MWLEGPFWPFCHFSLVSHLIQKHSLFPLLSLLVFLFSLHCRFEHLSQLRILIKCGFFSLLESVSLNTSECPSKTQHFIQVSQGKECGVVWLPRISPSLPAQRPSSGLEQSLCSWWDRVVGREVFWWLSFMKWILLPSHTWRQQVGRWLWKLALSPAARIPLCLHAILWWVGGEACFGLCFVSLKLWKGVSPAAVQLRHSYVSLISEAGLL